MTTPRRLRIAPRCHGYFMRGPLGAPYAAHIVSVNVGNWGVVGSDGLEPPTSSV